MRDMFRLASYETACMAMHPGKNAAALPISNPVGGTMNDRARVVHRSRPAWPPTARVAAAIIVAATLVPLAAACAGSPSSHVAQLGSTTGGPSSAVPGSASSARGSANAHRTSSEEALAFSQCMRARGVPEFPDPNSSGGFDKSKVVAAGAKAGSSQLQAAQRACQHLLPNGGNVPDRVKVEQMRAQALKFSQCVRRHGVPNFPDPGSDGRIPDPSTLGIDQGSPQFEAANHACRRYRPPYVPSNAAYNAWARTSSSG
jgi:hypothetical protein